MARALASADEAVARIVHDLHAPLTVIRGLCAALARGESLPERRRALALIDGETLRLAAGLRGLVDGGREGPVGPVDLTGLAAAARERFAAVAASAGAALDARLPSRPVWVRADAHELDRAVGNLLRNALAHGGGTPVTIGVTVRADRVALRVRDRGPGVPVGDRARIFTAGDRGSAPRAEGRGLGLAIARDIAERHGGTLTLDPIGPGACFRLLLPLAGGPSGAGSAA